MFLAWYGWDLVLSDLVWYYWGQVRSELVSFGILWCLMVWFGVIYPFLWGYGWFIVWFGCDLVLNDLVWYYWVRLGQSWFVFGVVWCLMVSFRVIFTVFGSNGCFIVWFGCDLIRNDFVWYYWSQVSSVLFLLLVWICVFWCCLVWFVYFWW